MTTPQPYSGDFSVPPQVAPATITEDMLPPAPPRPATATAAAVLLGLFGLTLVGGMVWRVVEELTASAPYDRGAAGILVPLLLMLLFGGAVGVLLRLVWLGSQVGSILTMVLTGYLTWTTGLVFVGTVRTLVTGGSVDALVERYGDNPASITPAVAGLICLPILILLALPPSWRWSRKAGMIRQIRALIRKGRPVTRLPQQIFD